MCFKMPVENFQPPDPQTLWGWFAGLFATAFAVVAESIRRASKVQQTAEEAKRMAKENADALADVKKKTDDTHAIAVETRGMVAGLVEGLKK